MISTNVALLLLVCVQAVQGLQRREHAEMMVEGFPHQAPWAELQEVMLWPLPLGGEVAARRPW